ncbi:metallophosphoesterase [Halorubrum vacuolatum]|uniref:UDP-2,3-diacylglucosamine pyrophosphatase LpxH n=1 Tax=Halorubrum vacuolatum TaxID=63740 RepID=A0A238X122_HALVU|nr:metallophosphoesterase [Halorubrum vacuolatum]SNR52547.1 UDP-2,3-diacylglucosamine pyrophosphatase LpxH [Halorubrum vacuolatum]
MIVAVSDVHLGVADDASSAPVKTEFGRFLDYLREDLRPDHLVLNGDIEDLWRRDMRTLTRENYDVFASLSALRDEGTEVHYVLGNHDWYARHDAGTRSEPYYETAYETDLTLESDGVAYAFLHGHQFDPVQREWYFDKLALVSDDAVGATFSKKWATVADGDSRLDAVMTAGRLLYDRFRHGTWDDRVREMDRCETDIDLGVQPPGSGRYVESRPEVDWLCLGHTHDGGIASAARVANSGAWMEGRHTYLQLTDEPRLLEWNEGDPQEV